MAAAQLGYTFLYWDNVARPGDQIDRGIDPRQMPGALPAAQPLVYDPANSTQRPGPILRGVDDFFVQGLSVGLEFRY